MRMKKMFVILMGIILLSSLVLAKDFVIENASNANQNYFVVNGTTGDVKVSNNMTLGQKITFTLGEIIDNLKDGWLKITGGLEVNGSINISGTGAAIYFPDGTNMISASAGGIWGNVSNVATYNGSVNVTGDLVVNGVNWSQSTGAIIESGSNENGSYVKYADGTMVQWGNVTTTKNIATSYIGGFRSLGTSFNFPQEWSSSNYVFVPGAPSLNAFSFLADESSRTTTGITVIWTAPASQSSSTLVGTWYAIGRWTDLNLGSGSGGNGGIVNTITNENGTCTQYSNGVMDCFGMATVAVSINVAQNGWYRNSGATFTFDFPSEFVSTPDLVATGHDTAVASVSTQGSTNASMGSLLLWSGSSLTAANRTIYYSAKGRWTNSTSINTPDYSTWGLDSSGNITQVNESRKVKITGNLILGNGSIRWNETNANYEFYNGSIWQEIGTGGGSSGNNSAILARAYVGVAQNISTGSPTKIAIDTISFGADYVNTLNHNITPGVAGYYQVNGQVNFQDFPADMEFIVQVRVNGIEVSRGDRIKNGANVYAAGTVSDLVYLDSNDYVELYVIQNSGSNATLEAGDSARNYLSLVGPLDSLGGSSTGAAGIWDNVSGVATYDGDVNVTGGAQIGGALSVGSNATSIDLEVYGEVPIVTTIEGGAAGGELTISKSISGAIGSFLTLAKSRGTIGSPLTVADNDQIANILAVGYDGNNYALAGNILFEVDGTVTDGNVPSQFSIYTSSESTPFGNSFTMDSGGNVGIGTSNPGDKLEIVGNLSNGGLTLDSSTNAGINLERSNTNYEARIRFKSGTTTEWEVGVDNGTGSHFRISQDGFGGTDRFVINDTSGYIGIGTSNPTQALHVEGNLNVTGDIYANSSSLYLGEGKISFNSTSNSFVFYNSSGANQITTIGVRGSGSVPAGAIMAFDSATCPAGWTLADGTSGTPDLRGIFVRGSGTSGVIDYANGSDMGVDYGGYGNDSFQSFNVNTTMGSHSHKSTYLTVDGGNPAVSEIYNYQYDPQIGAWGSAAYHATDSNDLGTKTSGEPIAVNSSLGIPRTGSETTPAYYAAVYCVKVSDDSENVTSSIGTSGDSVYLLNTSKNFGIGTINPQSRLHVSDGTLKVSEYGVDSANVIITANGTGDANLIFDAQDGDVIGGDYAWIGQHDNGDFFIINAGTERVTVNSTGDVEVHNSMTLGGVTRTSWPTGSGTGAFTDGGTYAYYNGGNVGIGTDSPDTSLTIKGSGANDVFKIISWSDDETLLNFNTAGGDAFLDLYNDTEAVMTHLSAGDDSYFIGGGVGIGTASPTQKLDVNGSINLSLTGAAIYFPDGTNMTTAASGSGDSLWTNVSNVATYDGSANVTGDLIVNGVNWSQSTGAIIESGGNDSVGYYVKYADGTMVQWGNGTLTASTEETNAFGSTTGSTYYTNDLLSFPVEFNSIPVVISQGYANTLKSTVWNIGTASFNIQQKTGTDETSADYSWVAYGRWTDLNLGSGSGGNGGIVNTITNENGTCTQYSNGIMDCYGIHTEMITVNLTSSYGGYYSYMSPVYFPSEFVTIPTISVTLSNSAVSVVADGYRQNISLVARSIDSLPSNQFSAYWRATGRWTNSTSVNTPDYSTWGLDSSGNITQVNESRNVKITGNLILGNGSIRWNETNANYEFNNGSVWQEIGTGTGSSGNNSAILARAYVNSSQSISGTTWTRVNITAPSYGSGYIDSVNHRITPGVAGYYQVNGQVGLTVAAGSEVIAEVRKSGAPASRGMRTSSATGSEYVTVSDIIYLNSTDYLELFAYSSAAATVEYTMGSGGNYLSLVGPLDSLGGTSGDSVWMDSSGNATFTSGNVGIGTTAPEASLHVNQSGTSYGDGFRIENPDGENWEMLVDSNGNLRVGWNFSAPPVMKFNNDSNVGIGIINPQEELHIDSIDSDSAIMLTTLVSGNAVSDGFYIGLDTNDDVSLMNRENGNFSIGTNGNVVMTIDESGNVGIGTASPGAKLDVNGSIRADNFYTESSITQIGTNAGFGSDPTYQVALGAYSGQNMTSGNYQVAIGFSAGNFNSNSYQVALGWAAGYQNSGTNQIAIGQNAGYQNSGAHSIGLGYYAGRSNTGDYVTGIGYEAARANTGDNVVAIGYEAGEGNADDNQFIVKQNNVNSIPLIQGNFSSGKVGIGTSSPSSKLDVNGSISVSIDTTTSNITLDEGDSIVLVNASSDNVTVNLPAAVSAEGRQYAIKRIDSNSSNKVIIEGNGAETIDLALNLNITSQFTSYDVVSDGSNWWII